MFSYTVMLIDLIDPDGFINTGQQRQHCQQPYADRSAENIVSVTPRVCAGSRKLLSLARTRVGMWLKEAMMIKVYCVRFLR